LYFTQIDKQKEETKIHQKEAEIYKKMNRIKNDQLKRIEGLQKEQDNSLVKAKIMQTYIAETQAIIEILIALLQSGLQWKQIWRMIKEEKRAGNPLATIINELDLEKHKAVLIFNTAEIKQEKDSDEYFSEFTEDMIVKIDVDLTLTAQANIQKYFEIKKKTQSKEERTKDKANEAIKHAEDQARRALQKTRNEQKLKTTARKPFWFEKYDWFISSENYLIISGKNAQQNEELVKTYLGKRDVYVHSEMAGSASCIIKNPSLEEVSPVTLNEVGIWAICHSRAWDAKIVTSAFWVWGDQVSKTPQSGEYLVTGSFMIRGKKNYVNPQRLELGCTVLFKLDDDSVANHLNERRNRLALGEGSETTEKMLAEDQAAEEFEVVQDDEAPDADDNDDEKDNQEDPQDQTPHDELVEEVQEKPALVKNENTLDENQEEGEVQAEEGNNEEPEENLEENLKEEPEEETIDTTTKQSAETPQDENDEEEPEEEKQGQVGKFDKKEKGKNAKQNKKQNKGNDKNQVKDKEKEKDSKVDLQQLPRGKKKKLLKMKKKYADQDEEEKKIKMELIGSKDVQANKKKNKKQDSDPYYKDDQNDDANGKKQNKEKNKGGQDQKQKKDQNNANKKGNKQAKPKPQQVNNVYDESEQQEIQDIMDEENIKVVENVDISVLDKLTGVPKANDTILFAVPMCGPYSMMNTHKYKVKILPGTLKRGKARKLIQEIFGSVSKGFEIENALLRAIPEDQLLEVLPKG